MLDQPQFTIAIPVVKTNFFHKTLKSAINQTFTDYEIIVLNNANNQKIKIEIQDITLEASKTFPIRYYENEEQLPPVQNWNKCLKLAKGNFFCILSDDDEYGLEYLNEISKAISKYSSCNIFHVRLRITNEMDETISISTSCPEQENCLNLIYHRIRNQREQFLSDFIVKTSQLKNIGGFIDFPSACCTDDATWFKIANHGGIVFVNKILLSYRKSSINLSKNDSVENKIVAYNQYETWIADFLNNELIFEHSEIEIYKNLQMHLKSAFILNKGRALSLSNSRSFGFVRLIFNWLKYRKKYNIYGGSLIWATVFHFNAKIKKFKTYLH